MALCLLSFARGAYQLGEQSLWWDESLSLHRAIRPFSFIWSNSILLLYGTEETPITPDHHPPLYFSLLRLLVLVAGKSEFVLRYLSLASCVLLVPLLYQAGRRLFDPASGALAALLAAGSPLYLWAQQEARPYALGTLFAATAFYALLQLLVDRPSSADAGRRSAHARWWVALYIVATAAMLLTHYHTLQLLPAFVLVYLLARGHHKRRAFWALLATAAIAAGVTLYGLREIMPSGDLPGYVFIPLGTLLQDILRAFPLGVSGTRLVLYQWVAAGLLGAAVVILLTRRGDTRRRTVYLLLCLGLPVATIYILSYVRPVYLNIRHVIFASPFYYLLLAAGVAQGRHVRLAVGPRISAAVPMLLAVALLLVGMGRATYTYFADPLYDKEDHRAWGTYLTEHVRPGDVVFVYPGAVYELYTYYVSSPAPYYGIPRAGATTKQTVRQLTEIASEYDRLWMAHSLTPGWAYKGDTTLQWLRENGIRVASAHFTGHLNTFPVYAYRLDPPVVTSLPEDASPVSLGFGEQLHLLGYRSVAEPVEAGHPLLLSLYWTAVQPLDEDYRFSLSLEDAAGDSWALMDYVPYDSTYPLADWPVGSLVRDDVDLDVPLGTPPGRYTLHVSIYPAEGNGPALPVHDLDSDQLMGLIVPIGEVTVARPQSPPRTADLSIPRTAHRRYGDLALLGHNLQGGSYERGDAIYLDLHWRALRAPRRNERLTLQLIDAKGTVQASRKIAPAQGYPTSSWQKGEYALGKHRFRIPLELPAGVYGLWLAPDQDSLPASIWPWSNQRVQLGTLSIREGDDERDFVVPPVQHKLHAILDDQVELLGYDLAEGNVRPGESVSCTLYWRGLQEMSRDYTVFTHLVAPDGTTWGQWDNEPQQGRSPTTRWVPGQVVADTYEIPLSADTPEGVLTLYAGMYDRLTMTRLPLLGEEGTAGGDAIVVTQIQVVAGAD